MTISDDELAYQLVLAANLRAAQAAWQSWAAWMAAKYELGPRDSITEDGRIVRVAEEVAPE